MSYPSSTTPGKVAPVIAAMVGKTSRVLARSRDLPGVIRPDQ